ncbi:MAG: flavin reductase [Planctomycetes bacterium]|nr:flavin reductase [Planctomycetota bacterium]
MTDDLRETIGPVLGRIPSGVFILTASDGNGHETGMLASWVQQAAFDPPMVTVVVNRKRFLNDWLQQEPKVALSLIGESQTEFLKHFGRGFEADQSAFEGLNISRGANGLPILADAIGYLEGNIVSKTEAGDHVVYVVEITSAGAGEKLDEEKPMVHIRKNGFGY